MRYLTVALLGVALTVSVPAEDKDKKEKSETVDPITGQKTKVKRKVKAESDGDYKLDEKVKSSGSEGKSKSKTKVRAEDDGDYKAKTKVSGPNGKYESKTKVDK